MSIKYVRWHLTFVEVYICIFIFRNKQLFYFYASYQFMVHLAKQFQRRRLFRNQPISNKNILWRPCLLTDRNEMSNLDRGPSIDATKFQFIWPSGFRGDFKKLAIRNKNCLWRPCLLMDLDQMCNLYRGPSIYASYKVTVHLAKQFLRRRFFRNHPIRNKNCLWWPCLLTDRDQMSNCYRGPSIDASYQVTIHLAKRFQRIRFFRNQPIRNKNCLWQPCLLTDRNEMSNLHRGPSYQVSIHLAKRFQMRRFLNIGQSETRIACGGHVC